MKNKLMLLALTLTLIVVSNHAVLATGAGNKCVCPNRASSQNPKIPLAEKLKLSDRQVQQLKEINLSTYQATKVLKIKLLDAKFELRQLNINGTDKSAIDAKMKEINDLRTQIHKLQQQKWQRVQAILTAEQQSQLKEMKDFGHHGGCCKDGCPQPK